MSNPTESGEELEQILELPRLYQQTVPAEYIDMNGHMNVMYYTGVGNMAIGHFFGRLGLSEERFASGERGMFALRQVISYLRELREGDEIAVHTGLVGYDAKRLHFVHYIVNLTRPQIASRDERLAMYIDLATRRSTAFEPEILSQLERVRQDFARLDWRPQLSGAIQLKPLS